VHIGFLFVDPPIQPLTPQQTQQQQQTQPQQVEAQLKQQQPVTTTASKLGKSRKAAILSHPVFHCRSILA
jgi:hypothetical protein